MTDLIESEDELLDPQPGPAAAAPPHRLAAVVHRLRARLPLGGDGSEIDPARRRRMTLGGLLALALAAGAGATGVLVHSRDLHTTQAHAEDRMLLHLLGGGATLTFDAGGPGTGTVSNLPGTFGAPLNAYFTLALRNDGAKPLQVTGVGISVPGVDVLGAPSFPTLAPGDSEAVTAQVAVHCTASDLPQYASGATVTVRTPAAKGMAAGAPTTVPLAFDPGHPAEAASGSGSYFGENPDFGEFSTGSFYRLCGDVLGRLPSRVSATAVSGSPNPQNPVLHYSLHIDNNPDAAEMAVVLAAPPVVPGVSAQTDLAGPRQIGIQGLDVNVTDRITDCRAFGDYLAVRGGATEAANALDDATPVGLQPVDPRFQTTPTPLSTAAAGEFDGITPGTADLQATLTTQLAAVCPDL
jgi:hypothetical protein